MPARRESRSGSGLKASLKWGADGQFCWATSTNGLLAVSSVRTRARPICVAYSERVVHNSKKVPPEQFHQLHGLDCYRQLAATKACARGLRESLHCRRICCFVKSVTAWESRSVARLILLAGLQLKCKCKQVCVCVCVCVCVHVCSVPAGISHARVSCICAPWLY